MTTKLLEYYGAHKELLGDARSQAAIKASIAGLECIFSILDKYDIRKEKEQL